MRFHDQRLLLDPKKVAKMMVLRINPQKSAEFQREKAAILWNTILQFDARSLKRFLILVNGSVHVKNLINVHVEERVMLPEWSSCFTKLTIGSDFTS